MGETSLIEGARKLTLEVKSLRFSAYEMGDGPLVVCIHGFPDTPRSYRMMLPALAQAGFRAVAVTLRGYEPSSQPADNDYTMPALASDVCGWIDALGGGPAHVVGHDWGANLAYTSAVMCPEKVGKLVAIAVPHAASFAANMAKDLRQMRRSWYMYFFQLRGFAERAVRKNDFAFLDRRRRDWSPGWTPDPGDLRALHAMFAEPGVVEAALGYYRAAFDRQAPNIAETQRLLTTPIPAPTLGICGEQDGCIGVDIFERSMPSALFAGGVRVLRVAGAGHFAHAEKPDEVNRMVINHLKG